MSNQVYRELSDDFVRRMRNWARWAAGGGVLGMGVHPMWRVSPRGSRAETPIGIIGGEASDTQDALDAIPARYGQAVKLYWQYEGQSAAYLARRCACDYRTYESRVIAGHERLRAELYRRAEQARMEGELYRRSASMSRC